MSCFRKPPVALAAAALAASSLCSGAALAITYDWTGGNFTPGTTSPHPLLDPDVLNITGASGKSFNGVAFTNQSVVTWQATGGTVSIGGGATVNNAGLWISMGDNTLSYPGGGGTLHNTGTFRKSGGTGVTTIGAVDFVNSGTIEAQTGTIRVSGSANTFNAGSVFTGAGLVEVSSNSQFNGSFTSGNLVLAGGTHTGNGALLDGSVTWTGGTMAGTWTVAAGQALNISGSGGKTLQGASTLLTNAGTVNWADGTVTVGGGAGVLNQGLWNAQGDHVLSYPGGGGTFTNTGTFRKSGGAGVTTVGSMTFVNSGTIEVQAGTVRLSGGPNTFNAGSVFTGAGVVEVTTNSQFNGSFASGNLVLAGGNHNGSGAVLNDRAGWTAGNMTGTWTVAAGAALDISGSTGKTLQGGGHDADQRRHGELERRHPHRGGRGPGGQQRLVGRAG